MNTGSRPLIDKIIEPALEEDLGPGDLTTWAIIDP
jgi:nicotinate-nucleotide pyrophosphorylase